MSTILTIPEIIEVGRVSTYLSANYTSRQALFGGNVTKPVPPVQIAFVTDALDWGSSGGAETAASLRSTANYLYWLCGMFQLQAQRIISGSGGGSVSPTPGSGALVQLNFTVAASGTTLIDGQSSVTFDGTGSNPDFRGFNLLVNKNGTPLAQISSAPVYYTWNKALGVLLVVPAAFLGDEFQITAV